MTDEKDRARQPLPEGATTFLSSTTGTPRTFSPGDLVDKTYKLTSLLGKGGMGIVFACHHIVLGKEYAIKILSGEQLSEEYWTRFRAEAQALAKLNHPGIVGIHNMGVDGGQFPYYVMDLLSGESLDQLIERDGPLPPDQALEVFTQIADALGAAHLQGIIHRDVKPSNLMVLKDGRNQIASVKIVDFGIARLSKQGFATQSQTKTGMIVGTPFYMSPEQCQGLKVDERSDIYSLGCTLFEALTGTPPFRGENAFQTFMMHQTTQAPSLANMAPDRSFPETLESAVAKMLAKSPTERYQTMAQVKHDLERVRAGKSVLTQGLSTTIAPGKDKTTAEDMQSSRQRRHQEEREHDSDNNHQHWSKSGLIVTGTVILGLVVLMTLIGVWSFSILHHSASRAPLKSNPTPASAGYPAAEYARPEHSDVLETLFGFDKKEQKRQENILLKRLARYRANPLVGTSPFKVKGDKPGFLFPQDFMIAAIRFGDAPPFMVTDFVPLPPGKPVYLYLFRSSSNWPGILDKFGPEDLNGLEVVSAHTDEIVQKISRWKQLEELSFFSTILRLPFQAETAYEESIIANKDLAKIDHLVTLRSLGLCGPQVSGDAILKMHLLDTLHTLKLKNISTISPLLNALPSKDNLKELWLVNQHTTDEQLEVLTHMKNLAVLRIRRSALTPASIRYFKLMPALKHLHLDQDWPAKQKMQFKQELPAYEYEAAIDKKYWQMLPDVEP